MGCIIYSEAVHNIESKLNFVGKSIGNLDSAMKSLNLILIHIRSLFFQGSQGCLTFLIDLFYMKADWSLEKKLYSWVIS